MKKVFLLSTFLVGSLLFYQPSEAQSRVHVNINPAPSWGQYDPYRYSCNEVVYDHHRWSDGYRDPRDWDNRDWRQNHDRFDERAYSNRHGDEQYGHYERGRANNRGDRDRRQDDRRQDDYRNHDHRRGRW